MMKKYCFGAHLPMSEGWPVMAMMARAYEMKCVQFFLGSPQRMDLLKWKDADLEKLRVALFGLKVYVHAPYMINPCVDSDSSLGRFQKVLLRRYLELGSMLRIDGLVIHPGCKKELPEEKAAENVVSLFQDMFRLVDNVTVLFEIDAGITISSLS